MKSIVAEWISNLAIISVLAALVDMVLPNGNMRKYTDFLFGLVIIVMFLHPLLMMAGKSYDIETSIFQNSIEMFNNSAKHISRQVEKNQKDNLEQFIKTNLEENLSLQLKHKTGLNIDDVKITFGNLNGETDYSTIQRIDIYATLQNQEIQIDSVVINSEDASYDYKGHEINKKSQQISKIASEIFDIEQELIYVYIN